jgi:hypothetical protein
LVRGHPLLAQLRKGLFALAETCQPHPPQDLAGLGELHGVVLDDLHVVAPGVEKIEPGAVEDAGAEALDGAAHRGAVVDHQAEVAGRVGFLGAPFSDVDELVADVDEGHPVVPAAQGEVEDRAVEGQRLIDAADLQGHVVDADHVRLVVGCRHGNVSFRGQFLRNHQVSSSLSRT